MASELIASIERKSYYMKEEDIRKILNIFTQQLEAFENFEPGDKLVINKNDEDIMIAKKEPNRLFMAPITRWIGSQGRDITIKYMRSIKKNIESLISILNNTSPYNYVTRSIYHDLWIIKRNYNKGVRSLWETYKEDIRVRDNLQVFLL